MKKIIIECMLFVFSVTTVYAEHVKENLFTRNNNYPEVACFYDTQVITFSRRPTVSRFSWHFWRNENRIEKKETLTDTGEIWERDKNGQITYLKIFNKQRRVIEYASGDLKALYSYPDWDSLMDLIYIDFLRKKLTFVSKEEFMGKPAQRFQGQSNNIDIEIVWLIDMNIPGFISYGYPDRTEITALKELHLLENSPWEKNIYHDYVYMDYADLGDSEADPFVKNHVLHSDHHAH